jgi:hypothetical protein
MVLLLAGCLSQSRIQEKYVAAQDDCRAQAEIYVGNSSMAVDPDSPGAKQVQSDQLVAQFSDCMNKAGWHVAVPKPATPLPTTAQVTPSSVGAGPSVSARGLAQPAATGASTGATPAAPPAIGPASIMPNPPPAVAPAQYQPGRPGGADAGEVPYGTGAGRQF